MEERRNRAASFRGREKMKFKEDRKNISRKDRRATEIVTHSKKKERQKIKRKENGMTFVSALVKYNWNSPIVLFDFLFSAPNYVCRISNVSSVLNICHSSHGFGNPRHDGVKISWRAKCIHDHGAYACASRLIIIIINIPIWRKWEEKKHKCARALCTRAPARTDIFYFYRRRQWKTASTSAQHRKTKWNAQSNNFFLIFFYFYGVRFHRIIIYLLLLLNRRPCAYYYYYHRSNRGI